MSEDIAVNAEFRQRDSRHLTIHECSGLRPLRLQSIKDFIETHSHPDLPLSQRLHAIWYEAVSSVAISRATNESDLRICVPMSESDFIDGVFGEGREILGLGGELAQRILQNRTDQLLLVPVVVVFTKFDLVVSKVLSGNAGVDSRNHENARATAHRMSEEHCRTFLRGNPVDVPSEMVSSEICFRTCYVGQLSKAVVFL